MPRRKRYHDKEMWNIVEENINMAVPWYLMASIAYYEQDNPILKDTSFDKLAKILLDRYDEVTHWHRDYITKDMLRAGTFFGAKELPTICWDSLNKLRKDGVKVPKVVETPKEPEPEASGTLDDFFV